MILQLLGCGGKCPHSGYSNSCGVPNSDGLGACHQDSEAIVKNPHGPDELNQPRRGKMIDEPQNALDEPMLSLHEH